MDYQSLIQTIKDEKCRECKVGKLIASLENMISNEAGNAVAPASDSTLKPAATKGWGMAKDSPAKGSKVCNACRKEKPFDEFARNSSRSDGHASICKACFRAKYGSGKKTMSTAPAFARPPLDNVPEEKPWKCDECPKAFSTEMMLDEHLKMRHGAQ